MPHIDLPPGVPGIRSLALFRPETAKPLYALAQVLLRDASPLTPAERELIAVHVSRRNNCIFCASSHAAAACELYGEGRAVVDTVMAGAIPDELSPKMRALLVIAGQVQQSGKAVTAESIAAARAAGANDRDLHDTVLIAATFSMFNRYVDGLATLTPTDSAEYAAMGKRLSTVGYAPPRQP
jgi:uncharacterized peroxidase-related enzyme